MPKNPHKLSQTINRLYQRRPKESTRKLAEHLLRLCGDHANPSNQAFLSVNVGQALSESGMRNKTSLYRLIRRWANEGLIEWEKYSAPDAGATAVRVLDHSALTELAAAQHWDKKGGSWSCNCLGLH